MRLNSVREAKSEFASEYSRTVLSSKSAADDLRSPPAVAVGINPRGAGQFALAVRVQDPSVEALRVASAWERRYDDEVDLRVTGRVVKRSGVWYRNRTRPLVVGASVAHEQVTAGTIGGFVHRADGAGAVELLSNNHVLAHEDRASLGDRILQPGPADGGTVPQDIIGSLSGAVPLNPAGVNFVDCAVSSLDDESAWSLGPFQLYNGLIGVLDLSADEASEFPLLAKFGRTTGHTTGNVSAIELDQVMVQYDTGPVRFDNQIEVEGVGDQPFSSGGDSGSLVFAANADGALAVGLLFAGSTLGGANGQGLTYVNPMQTVLDSLNAVLIHDGAAGH